MSGIEFGSVTVQSKYLTYCTIAQTPGEDISGGPKQERTFSITWHVGRRDPFWPPVESVADMYWKGVGTTLVLKVTDIWAAHR